MGNVNGREGGEGEDAAEEEEEEEGIMEERASSERGRRAVVSERVVLPPPPPPAPELMGQSPPHTPRAPHSPLMFTPQVPMVPLKKPDEISIPNQYWTETSLGFDETDHEQGIPTIITWSYGGKDVSLEGSWDNWKTRVPLHRSGKDHTIMKVLPSGVYQYRFIVDGQSRCAPDLPWAQDDVGNTCNILDLQDNVPEDLGSISSFETPQSPDSSYNNLLLGNEDFAKEPPMVPLQLQMTQLNVPSSHMEISASVPRPQHVVLNHLYMQKAKGGPPVVALGSTHRFLAKYVTVVLYKSLQK